MSTSQVISDTLLKNAFPSTYPDGTLEKEDEAALLKAARRLDQVALATIFDQYASAIYGYILRLCHDPDQADQIVGDVFSKLLDKLAEGKGPRTNLRSYLYQIAYHTFIDQTRFNQHVAPIEIVDYLAGDSTSVYEEIENRALLDAVLLAINNDLSVDQRHVIVLRFLEGMNLQETAKILDKSVNNIKVLQNRGIEKIRKVLSRHNT